MMDYLLKHRNINVAEFRIDKETNNVDYVNILDEKFSPVNIKASEGGKLVSFNNWLINRCIPNSRDGVERLKREYKVNDLKIIMLALYGLSLSDHYWVDREPFNKKWENVNLFDNLNFKYTPYFAEKHGKEWVSLCKCIADKNVELVSADDICKRYGIEKSYEAFVKLGEEKECSDFKNDINTIIIADFLIENTDRHWNNFGILRDGETGKWIGTIPLFDNGYSLWNNDFIDINKASSCLSFEETNIDCLKYVNINSYIKNVPDMIDIFDRAFNKYENSERKNALRGVIKIKQKEIEKSLKS